MAGEEGALSRPYSDLIQALFGLSPPPPSPSPSPQAAPPSCKHQATPNSPRPMSVPWAGLLQHLDQGIGDGHAREPLLPSVRPGLRVPAQPGHQRPQAFAPPFCGTLKIQDFLTPYGGALSRSSSRGVGIQKGQNADFKNTGPMAGRSLRISVPTFFSSLC